MKKNKQWKVFVTLTLVFVLTFTPFSLSLQSASNVFQTNKAQAIEVSLIGDKSLNAEFEDATDTLSMEISGNTLANVSAVGSYNFQFKLPEEFQNIFSNAELKNNATINYSIPALGVGSIVIPETGSLTGDDLTLDASNRIIQGSRNQLLGISVGSEISAELVIDLGALGITELPSSPDGSLDFLSEISGDGFLDVSVLEQSGASDSIATTDATAPDQPEVNPVNDQDTNVTGTGEAGTDVTVTIGGETYTGTVDGNGDFSVGIPQQPGGTEISVTLTDGAGNESEATVVTVEDTTAPEAPTVNDVTDTDTEVTGTGEAGSDVTVAAGGETYTGTVDENGDFTVTIPEQSGGTEISVTLTDGAGNESEATVVTVEDTTAPEAPTVNDVTDADTEVTGTGEAGTDVTVTIGGETYTGTVDENGDYTVSIPTQTAGTEISVTLTDGAGNESDAATVSVTDGTAPEAPTVNDVTDTDTEVTGTGEAGSDVTVAAGGETYTGTVDENGDFTVTIPEQPGGTEISVTLTDGAGNESEATVVTVEDTTAPEAPTVNDVTDADTEVTGTGEAGTDVTVTIGGETYTGTVDENGDYTVSIPTQTAGTEISVTLTDDAGNESDAATVSVTDGTAPEAPTVNDVTDTDTEVTGTGEAGSDVTVAAGGETYTGTVDENGDFTVTIPEQPGGTEISVTLTDGAGNESEATVVTVEDTTAPEAPTVNDVTDADTEVTGTGEAGTDVTVTIGGETYTGTVDENGDYTVSIPTQTAGTEISVTLTDGAGNESDATTVSVTDVTAPEAPEVNSVTQADVTVTGNTEPGAEVTVQLPGDVTTQTTADENGEFTADLPRTYPPNTSLSVTATDAAGNVSESTEVRVERYYPETPLVVDPVIENSDYVTGSVPEDAVMVRLIVNGQPQRVVETDGEVFSIYSRFYVDSEGNRSRLKPDDVVTVDYGVGTPDELSDSETVVQKTFDLPTIEDISEGDSFVRGTGDTGTELDVVRLSVNGVLQRTAPIQDDGSYEIYARFNVDENGNRQRLKAGDEVTIDYGSRFEAVNSQDVKVNKTVQQ
ncbi:Ig-like domain-containing protein [Salimicrobium sp. PL1-032A]|uniref:Ig-like domain-containing protein n=1 Tax=Salimicrobium sp. PL1-032A TaxID=3095364 RepID=UPI003261014F